MTIRPHSNLDPDEEAEDPTRLKCLALRHAAGEKTRVDIDVSYLRVVSRERLSILIYSWDEVSEVDRNMIWEDVLVSFTF